MKARAQFGLGAITLGAAVLLLLAPGDALAQRGAGQGRPQDQRKEERQAQKRPEQRPPAQGQNDRAGQRRGPGQAFQPGRVDGGMSPLERLREMTPEQQQRAMNSVPFRRLPPQQQQHLRQELRRWNAMSPEQQQEIIDRKYIWDRMTPEQRQHIREVVMPRWQQLEPERRRAIQRRLRVLHDLDDEQRAARLKDEAFLTGLSPDDREMLATLAKLRLPPPEQPEPPPQHEPPLEQPPRSDPPAA